MKKISIFLIIIQINVFYSYIVLPIEVLPVNNYISKHKKNSVEEIMSRDFMTPLLTKISIGTKLQTIPLLLKPKSNYFLFSSSNPLENQTINYTIKEFYNLQKTYSKLYNESVSTTYKSSGACQKGTIKNKKPIAEQICPSTETFSFVIDINDTQVKRQSYKAVNFDLGKNPKDKINGIIGLSQTSFLSILKSKNIINNLNWYFDFDSWNSTTGKLVIGTLPHEINETNCLEEDITYTNTNQNISTNFWEMHFDKIYFQNPADNKNIDFINQTIEFAFDSNYIIGTSAFKKYFLLILNELIKEKICIKKIFTGYNDEFQNITSNYEFYICKKENITIDKLSEIVPSLFFYSIEMETTFEITKVQILKEIGNYIYINIIFNQDEKNSDKWILGKPFIFKYKFIFNSNEGKIAFYNPLKNKKNDTENNTEENNSNNSNDKVYKLLIIIPLIIYLCAGPIIVALKQITNKNENKDDKNEKLNDNKIEILPNEENTENTKEDKNNIN